MEGHAHPHDVMRRKDREITDHSEIDEILMSTRVMHLALADHDVPFLVPLFYTYDGSAIYFHFARVGSKIEILKRNPKVCFEVSIDQRPHIASWVASQKGWGGIAPPPALDS